MGRDGSAKVMDLARSVLGSMLAGVRGSVTLDPASLNTEAQRRLLGVLGELESEGVEPSPVNVHARITGDAHAYEEMRACMASDSVYLPAQLDGLVRDLHKRAKASALRAGAAALLGRLEQGAVPESVAEAVGRLSDLAKPSESSRAPLHVSEGMADVFTQTARPRVPMGLATLEAMTVEPGHLCVVGARPGIGKTAFLGTVAMSAAKAGWDTLFVSLEMPGLEIRQRLLAAESRMGLMAVKGGNNASELIAAAQSLSALPLWVEDGDGEPPLLLDLDGIYSLVRLFAELEPERPKLVLVDYLQYVRTRKHFQNRHEAVAHVAKSLKGMAKDSKAALIVAAQLNRKVEDRGKDARPQMADLAESAGIEHNADEILFLHRDMGDPANLHRALIKVAKNRHGPLWTDEVAYAGERCVFEDRGWV